jgi:hypothetical protein
MTLNPSEVASIAWWLSFWEYGEYVSEAAVVLGCIGEYIAEYAGWARTRWTSEQLHALGRRSLFILTVGIGMGLLSLIKTNTLSGEVITSLGEQATEASQKAGKALSDADAAAIRSATAVKDSGDAINKSKAATEAASIASGLAGDANGNAREAFGLARTVQGQASDTSKQLDQLAKAAKDLESEVSKTKDELTGLAVCNAPRVITNWFIGGKTGGKTYVDALMPMAGQKVSIEFIPYDAEARRAALDLANALLTAKWDLQKPLTMVEGLRDGVSVQPFPFKPDENNIRRLWSANDVAYTLVDFLHSYNWTAQKGWGNDRPESMPDGAIRIQVGLYPAVSYVSPPGSADINRAISKMESDRRAKREEAYRKFLATVPFDLLEEAKRRIEAGRKLEARYSNPCEPLAPQ